MFVMPIKLPKNLSKKICAVHLSDEVSPVWWPKLAPFMSGRLQKCDKFKRSDVMAQHFVRGMPAADMLCFCVFTFLKLTFELCGLQNTLHITMPKNPVCYALFTLGKTCFRFFNLSNYKGTCSQSIFDATFFQISPCGWFLWLLSWNI